MFCRHALIIISQLLVDSKMFLGTRDKFDRLAFNRRSANSVVKCSHFDVEVPNIWVVEIYPH